jgi:hypothetical protein
MMRMKAQRYLSGPLCMSKKKRDLRRLLLLIPGSKPRRSHRKKKKLRVAPTLKRPDALETQADSLKDKSELDELKEGAPQKEIDISTTDEQVSIESIP